MDDAAKVCLGSILQISVVFRWSQIEALPENQRDFFDYGLFFLAHRARYHYAVEVKGTTPYLEHECSCAVVKFGIPEMVFLQNHIHNI